MTLTTWLLVATFGAAGALLRHEVTTRATDSLVALHGLNVVGSLALGVLLGLRPLGPLGFALAAGGLGSVTSFSTWAVGVLDRDEPTPHLLVPAALALGAALVGVLAGRALA